MSFIMDVEQRSFWAAESYSEINSTERSEQRVLGYIIAPRSMHSLWKQSVTRGYIFRWFLKWIRGYYSLGFRPLFLLGYNKLGLIRQTRAFSKEKNQEVGQILSLAVDEKARGCGVGTELLKCGMDYLKEEGIPKVKLEVRTDNYPARHIYEKLGFKRIDTMEDAQARWIVMVKEL